MLENNNHNRNENGIQPPQGGWSPYQGDQGRQEFFQRYDSVFREPQGSYQGSYGSSQTPPPSYQPQTAAREKKHRSGKGWIAGLIAACMVVSVAGGALGAYGMNYLSRQEGTVFYQAVGGSEKDGETLGDGGTEQTNPSGVPAGYTGGALSVSEIAALASPSVVEISTEIVSRSSWFGQYVQSGAGSGVIFSEDGIIVTNDHVVSGASTITVRTKDGESYGLTPAILGDSDSLTVGEYAMAIGNPLGHLGGTVTDGIISALSREVTISGENMTLLQTNAAINPGNSGGGLFNEKGELVGIVNAKSSQQGSDTSIEGLGFAIPVNTVKNSVQELLDYGYVRGRAALGVSLVDVNSMDRMFQYRVSRMGVYVQSLVEGGASEKAGMKVGDNIIAIGDVAVSDTDSIKGQLNNYSVGDTIQVQVIRDGRTLTLNVVLDEFKPDTTAQDK